MILKLMNVSKKFGSQIIYQNVSAEFSPGCYLVRGPNGIGKTVLMEMMAGIIQQDQGSISLENVGENHSLAYKRKLCYVPSTPSFYPNVTGIDFIKFIYSVKRPFSHVIDWPNMLDGLDLNDQLQQTFEQMSLGNKKKLFLSTMALNCNQLIILDEPSSALDEKSLRFLIDVIKRMSEQAIIILTTHDDYLTSNLQAKDIQLLNSPILALTTEVV